MLTAIDEQLADTMLEAGLSFLAAQLLLAFFVFKAAGRTTSDQIHTFPGGARTMVIAAIVLVGASVLAVLKLFLAR